MPLFKIPQFVEMAVKDEETGEALYNALALMTSNPELKEEYLKIADQEKHHKARFQKILENLPEENMREQYKGQYQDYLNVLLSTKAFPQTKSVSDIVGELKNDREALELALRMEKDTLLFYYSMNEVIPDTSKKIVSDIMREEQVHIEELSRLLEKVGE